MLKHVHNTLARRNSANKAASQQNNSSSNNGSQASSMPMLKPARPPSPAPSTISSCSSLSSSSIFFSSTPNTSSGSGAYEALTLSPGSSSSGYSSTWSRGTRAGGGGGGAFGVGGRGRRRASISFSTGSGVGGAGDTSAGSRLSISSMGSSVSIDSSGSQKQGNGSDNMVPLRVYTDNGCLRPDIQYKTVPVTHTTTCRQIIGLILTKCKIRYKDPRLYGLAMELRIRAPNGADVETAVPLEDGAYPLRLQDCYPRGQARFTLKVNTGDAKLVKVHDETELLGWQYKSILISEKTTAGELIDILTRFTPPNIVGIGAGRVLEKVLQCRGTRFELQLVNEAWSQTLRASDLVIPVLQSSAVNQNNNTRLILCRERPPLPPRPASTISLYENVFSNISPTSSIASSSDSSSYSMTESDVSSSSSLAAVPSRPRPSASQTQVAQARQNQSQLLTHGSRSCPKCNAEYWRRWRSQSLSLSSGDSASTGGTGENNEGTEGDGQDEDALLLQAFELFNLSLTPDYPDTGAGHKNLTRSCSNGIRYEFFV